MFGHSALQSHTRWDSWWQRV